MKIGLCSIILLCAWCATVNAQIVINEGSNKNASIVLDEDGEYKDWIELYNAGNESVNLEGYSLTDDASNAQQWVFPA